MRKFSTEQKAKLAVLTRGSSFVRFGDSETLYVSFNEFSVISRSLLEFIGEDLLYVSNSGSCIFLAVNLDSEFFRTMT